LNQEVGHKLEAFILNHQAAEMLPDNLRHRHRFRLSDHLTLVPVTRQLLQEVVATFGEYKSEDDPYEDTLLMRLLPALTRMAVKVSSVSAVLYFEVDVWSGIGDRSAIVWHKGEAAYGPTWGTSQVAEAFRLFGQIEGLPSDWTVGLRIDRHRFTEDWVRDTESEGD
jgi:hypothetical protein